MTKKVFSVHLSTDVFSYLSEALCLETDLALARACRVALKNILNCADSVECANRIAALDIDYFEEFHSKRLPVSTTLCERQAIELASQKLSVSSNQVCSALVNSALLTMIGNHTKPDRITKTALTHAFKLNPNQNSVLAHLLSNGWEYDSRSQAKQESEVIKPSVYFAELGTGSGKTLLALYLAANAASNGQRTWIAVPSLSVQQQFLQEHKAKFPDSRNTLLALVSGRAEFVSHAKLIELIDQESSNKSNAADPISAQWTSQALQWIDKYADKPFGADRRRWLMGSFLHHVPSFPYADTDISLESDSDTDDFGELSYQDQFDLANRSDVVVLTHHYLYLETIARLKSGLSGLRKEDSENRVLSAIFSDSNIGKAKGRKITRADVLELIDQKNETVARYIRANEVGRIDMPQILLVDEAHLLEENFSKASTTKISIRRLPTLFAELMSTKQVKSDKSLNRIQKQINEICSDLGSKHIDNNGSPVHLNWRALEGDSSGIANRIEDLSSVISDVTITGNSPSASKFKVARYALKQMLKASSQSAAFFTNSPVRQYPQILVGSVNHTSEFRLLFNHLGIERTLLLSATIYMPNTSGAWSAARFLNNLGLQNDEAIGYRSIHDTWLTDPVTLFLPPKPGEISKDFGTGHTILQPGNSPDEVKSWIAQLSTLCKWVVDSAVGGTLILMTSYDSAKILYEQLISEQKSITTRLLVSQPHTGYSISDLKGQFISKYLHGERPIWIAVGTAWTGLNLSLPEISPEQDNLLTDLVIPRMPFGTNKSITAEVKKLTSSKHLQLLGDASSTLKQGVGRLIRRPGLQSNRRLFFMDSRVYSKERKAVLNMLNTLFRAYEKRGQLPRALIKKLIQSSDGAPLIAKKPASDQIKRHSVKVGPSKPVPSKLKAVQAKPVNAYTDPVESTAVQEPKTLDTKTKPLTKSSTAFGKRKSSISDI